MPQFSSSSSIFSLGRSSSGPHGFLGSLRRSVELGLKPLVCASQPGDLQPRERIAALETSMEHMTKRMDDMAPKVSAMHDIMMKAQGAKSVVFGLGAGPVVP